MIAGIKKMVFKQSPLQVAADELFEAELELLKARSSSEYAASLVDFNARRVNRLREFLAKGS
jgi:hypothetical protein